MFGGFFLVNAISHWEEEVAMYIIIVIVEQ